MKQSTQRLASYPGGQGQQTNAKKKLAQQELYNLCFQQIADSREAHYGVDNAMMLARVMMQIRDKFNTSNKGTMFLQQYYLNKGLKVFGEQGKTGVNKELDQMIKRSCFCPIYVNDVKPIERTRAQEAMMLLAEKSTQEVKGRMEFRGDGTRE